MRFLTDFRLLLLGLWLGAAVFFIGVAQGAFSVLPSRELAGLVVGRNLAVLNFSGLGIAAILIVTSLIGGNTGRFWLWAERFLLVVIAAACAIGQFVIGLWLQFTRAQMGKPIDEVAADDPLRIQFTNLHEYSVWVLFTGMAAGLIAFFLIARSRSSSAPATSKGMTSDPFDFSKEFKKS